MVKSSFDFYARMNPAIPDYAASRLAKPGTGFGFDSDGTQVTQVGIDFGYVGGSIHKLDFAIGLRLVEPTPRRESWVPG